MGMFLISIIITVSVSVTNLFFSLHHPFVSIPTNYHYHYLSYHYPLHYTTLHYTTLHYTTLHYTPLHRYKEFYKQRIELTRKQLIFTKQIRPFKIEADMKAFVNPFTGEVLK
jgi:hypothetical protein